VIVRYSTLIRGAASDEDAFVQAFSGTHLLRTWKVEAGATRDRDIAGRTAKAIWDSQNKAINAAFETGVSDWQKLVAVPAAVSVTRRRGYWIVAFEVEV